MKNTFINIFGTVIIVVLICYCFLDLFVYFNFISNSEFNLFFLFILNTLKIKGNHKERYYSTNKKDNDSNKTNKKNKMTQIILNIISLIFLIFIFYKFIIGLNLYSLLGFTFSFIFSSLISSFILNKFKFSNNKIVGILQKIIVFNIILLVALFICDYFNIKLISSINCEGTDDNNSNYNSSSDSNNSNTNSESDNNSKQTLFEASVKEENGRKVYSFKGDKETTDNFVTTIAEVRGKKSSTLHRWCCCCCWYSCWNGSG